MGMCTQGAQGRNGKILHSYATLLQGTHRLAVRDSKTNNPNCKESNTLHFTVGSQTEILVDVSFVNGEINLEFSSGAISHG